ncbi:MAG: DNA polymerase III subunit delta [Leptospiraceae bacterium]|nr:DNA polymerase III subunit delta [Leptospiraceae bacterium]MCP5493652.1 DNA polymerase III subunit delta [Leptospiraceae bacterium]
MAAAAKNITEYKNYVDFIDKSKENLPGVFIYSSLDSFEFDLIVDHCKIILSQKGEKLEVVVYVSEPGDFENFFSEIFNLSIFSSQKLVIIKSGIDFFKSVLTAGKKGIYDTFKKNIPSLSEKSYILIHYNTNSSPPEKLLSLFGNKCSLLKNRNYYPNERKAALEGILRNEKVTIDPSGIDEFIHRIHPNTGSYIKNIRKLKTFLNKKHFEHNDITEILFNAADFNPYQLVDSLFLNDRVEFFKEFSKLKPTYDNAFQLLKALTVILVKVDEIRKFKLLTKRSVDNNSDEFYSLLDMKSYSDKRKNFTKGRLRKEANYFADKVLEMLYDSLIQMNIKFKTGMSEKSKHYYFIQKMENIFLLISQRS